MALRRSLAFICLLLLTPLGAAAEGLPAWDGLPAESAQRLQASQRAYYNLEFDLAERLARETVAAHPGHPLPWLFLQGALLARLQELIAAEAEDAELDRRFDEATSGAIAAAEARAASQPGAWAELYRGGSLGARGMVRLYRSRYLAAYRDGEKAAAHLRECLRLDPGMDAAWLGLGQYEYYCGTLSGVLRFILDLDGEVEAGLDLLRRCGAGDSFGALAARVTLARILSMEQKRPQEALPYVLEARRAFPDNYNYALYALECAARLPPGDPQRPGLRSGVEAQWNAGWRPPGWFQPRLREGLRF